MRLKGITAKGGRYYKIVQSQDRHAGGKLKRQWLPLSRVADGMPALIAAIEAIDSAPISGGMPAAITAYLKHHTPSLTPAVRVEHARMFDKISRAFTRFGVEQVRPRDCLDFLDLFRAAPSARQAYKYRLSAFFAWSVVQEFCVINPLREIKIKGPPPHKTVWTDARFIAVEQHLDPMMRVYHRLSFLLWQRPTDIRRMQRRQIDGDVIHFAPGKTAASSGATVDVRITQAIRAELEAAAAISRAGNIISPFVIHTSTGTSYTRSGIYSAYRRADVAMHGHAGTIGLNAKDIRPYAATHAKRHGYSLDDIQARLAHARQGTTEGYIQSHDTPISEISLPLPGQI